MITGIFTAMALRGMAYVHKAKLLATANQIVIMHDFGYENMKDTGLAERMHRAKCSKSKDKIDPPVCGGRFQIENNKITFHGEEADCIEIKEIVESRLGKKCTEGDDKKKLTIAIGDDIKPDIDSMD